MKRTKQRRSAARRDPGRAVRPLRTGAQRAGAAQRVDPRDGRRGASALGNLDVALTVEGGAGSMLARRPVTAEETAKIMKLHHAEGWPVGTIGAQLSRASRHGRAGARTGRGSTCTRSRRARAWSIRTCLFLKETLAKYPRLRASRLWSMARARGYRARRAASGAIVSRLRPRRAAGGVPASRWCCPGRRRRSTGRTSGKLTIGRATRDLWAFVIVLSYSRVRFLRFSVRAAMPSFLAGHVAAFRFFGSVPRIEPVRQPEERGARARGGRCALPPDAARAGGALPFRAAGVRSVSARTRRAGSRGRSATHARTSSRREHSGRSRISTSRHARGAWRSPRSEGARREGHDVRGGVPGGALEDDRPPRRRLPHRGASRSARRQDALRAFRQERLQRPAHVRAALSHRDRD